MSEEEKTGIKGKDAFQLFPDIMKKVSPAKAAEGIGGKGSASQEKDAARSRPLSPKEPPPPPKPPDISWLWKEGFETVSQSPDIPTTMLVLPDDGNMTLLQGAFEEIGYLVEAASSEQAAIERMKYVNLAAVVLQTGGRNHPLESSVFHNHMKWLPMLKRRLIYYVIVGPDFHTAYDLQALSLSANLVINNRDIDKIGVLMRKGLREYENLFGPYLLLMREYGRK